MNATIEAIEADRAATDEPFPWDAVNDTANAAQGDYRSLLERLEADAKQARNAERDRKGRSIIDVVGTVQSQRQWPSQFAIAAFMVTSPKIKGVHPIISAKGTMTLEAGYLYRLRGVREVHSQYGEQLSVMAYEVERPADEQGVVKFLASGVLPGIGEARAAQLVKSFGLRILDILDRCDGDQGEAMAALCALPGISESKAEFALEHYATASKAAALLPKLYKYGITPYQAQRIIGKYGPEAPKVLADDPYQLMYDLDGFGFLTVDGIARKCGVKDDDPRRARAGVYYCLEQAAQEGHTWLTTEELLSSCDKELGLHRDDAAKAIEHLLARETPPIIAVHHSELGDGYARTSLHEAERTIVHHIAEALAVPMPDDPLSLESLGVNLDRLTDEQRAGVEAGWLHRFSVLTGGPGTGKTYTVRSLLDAFAASFIPVHCCAPTGKAAVRMEESTGRPAKTIHRLLGFSGSGFSRNEENPLPAGVYVVDESSMVDTQLMASLLRAVQFQWSRVILVGDVDQLPSVGPGAVLRDLISSGKLPVTRLTKIHRQAEGSAIIRNAHHILRGEEPESDNERIADWQWLEYDKDCEASVVADELLDSVCRDFPEMGIDPIRDVQILTPMRKLAIGVTGLNRELQKRLNPPAPGKGELTRGTGETAWTLRVGDKVMQTSNDYQKSVFNGEVGFVTHAHSKDGVRVDFGSGHDELVSYEPGECGELSLAYAMTIHKSQGSEFPIVVTPVHTQHWKMWSRQLLYTAVTRAKRAVVLLGTRKALRRAVSNAEEAQRNTMLREMLVGQARREAGKRKGDV